MFRVACVLVFWVCIDRLTVEGLQRNGDNVCVKQRLVRVNDVYASDQLDDWDCSLHYPSITCERISSGGVDVESLYFLEESLTCCPGWTRSGDDEDREDRDVTEDEDENDDDETDSCSRPCEDGYFGENCELECQCINSQPVCNRFDGACDCFEGWTGPQCDQRCPPMTWGPSCTLRSLFSCDNGGTNNPSAGDCLCSSRYEGLGCEVECPSRTECDTEQCKQCGTVQCEQCVSHSSKICGITRNSCICREGWQGRYCTDLCPLGYGGEFCEDECCSKNGRCFREPTEGGEIKCSCQDGVFGEACENTCPSGRYGRACKQTCQCPSCNPVTGECASCPEGFQGPMCLARCSASQWGPSCASSCSCPDNVACDVFTGSCSTTSFTWLIILCLLILVILAVTLLIGCRWYRRRRKPDGNQENEDVPAELEDNDYLTVGSSQHYNGSHWSTWSRESTAAQPIGTISSTHNGPEVILPNGQHGTVANNPTYDMDRLESARREGEWSVDRGQYNRPHVYDAPTGDGSTGGSHPGKVIHDYEDLRLADHAAPVRDNYKTAGPAYRLPQHK